MKPLDNNNNSRTCHKSFDKRDSFKVWEYTCSEMWNLSGGILHLSRFNNSSICVLIAMGANILLFFRASYHTRWHKILRPHTKSLIESPHFVAVVGQNVFSSFNIIFSAKRKDFLSQKGNYCQYKMSLHKKNKKKWFHYSFVRNKVPVKDNNFLSQ